MHVRTPSMTLYIVDMDVVLFVQCTCTHVDEYFHVGLQTMHVPCSVKQNRR